MMSLALAWPASAQSDTAAAYTFTTLAGYAIPSSADGVGPQARFSNPVGVAADTNGNTYVVDARNYTIRRISAAGVVSTIAGLPGVRGFAEGVNSASRFYSPSYITTDLSGNVYVSDERECGAGCFRNWVVRKISPVGTNWVVTTIASKEEDGHGDDLGFQIRSDGGLAADSGGNVYLAEPRAIRKISPIGTNWVVSTVANTLGYTVGREPFDGTPRITNIVLQLNNTPGIAADSMGSLYVAGPSTISKLTREGTNWVAVTIAGLSGSPGSVDGLDADARFRNPVGVAADRLGNIYLTDGGDTIRVLRPQGTNWVVSTLAGWPGNSGQADAVGTNALFNGLKGVTVDSMNNLAVADSGNDQVRKVTRAGVVRTLAGAGVVSPAEKTGSVDGVGSTARFNFPGGVAVDGAGNVYVADSGNSTIRVVTPAGIVSTIAGSPGMSGSADGVGSNARFSQAEGIAVDRAGNVFVADGGNSTIRMITPDEVITTIAGLAGSPGDVDGPGDVARLAYPYDIAADNAGDLFVVDRGNNKIRKLARTETNWLVSTVAPLLGDPNGIAAARDGRLYVLNQHEIQQFTPSGAEWAMTQIVTLPYFAYHIAVDGAGQLYVAGVSSRTVLKIAPAGTNWIVTTIGGTNPPPEYQGGNADGAGTDARFQIPYGIAADAAGNVYVSDAVNNNIRKGIFTQYAPIHPVDYAPPPRDSALTVTLVPPEANGQWRFPWELGWRNSGATVSNLVAGNYAVEFRSRAGWLAIPLNAPVGVTNSVSFTNEYYPTLSSVDEEARGSLTVNIGPSPPPGAGWRFLGDNAPFLPAGFTTNLSPDTYLIEFAPVNGFSKPPNQAVLVVAGLPRVLSATYLLASAPPDGTQLPFLVPTDQISQGPFGFNGQLQSDTSYGSGVAVQENVVLTAAHLVFNDHSLSYVSRAYWYFRQEKALFEPQPLPARGWYLLSGYAAQRTNDVLGGLGPESSSPQSRNLDVAAVYFLSSVAGGSHGGYLPSDGVPNPWLTGNSLKMLVGYPVDGSLFGNASITSGVMYQTEPQPYALTLANQQVYIAPWFLSYPGNSGGPLYAQFNGTFYPAGVYLGTLFNGTEPYASAVRAIDSSVTNLIALAASQGDSGTNYTGGGVILVIPSQAISSANPGYVQFQLAPPAAVRAGAGWRLKGDAAFSSAATYTRAVTSTNVFAVEFQEIPGWNTPSNQNVTVLPGQLTPYTAFYSVTNPMLVIRASGLGITGTTGTTYRVEKKNSLTDTIWLPVSTNTINITGFNLVLPRTLTNPPTTFYRLQWLP